MAFSMTTDLDSNDGFIVLILASICCSVYTPLCGYTVFISALLLDWEQSGVEWGKGIGNVDVSRDSNTRFNSRSNTLDDLLSSLVIITADSLLIYRFYTLWTERKWTLLLIGGLIGANLVTTCMTFIGDAAFPALRRDVYILSLLCFSLAITTLGTVFIIMRISSVTRQSPAPPNPAPYKRVQRILIDSGFIYSLCMFITVAVLPFLITRSSDQPRIIPSQIATYSQGLLTPFAGIAPTLVAFRVVREMPETEVDGTQRLSHLTFKRSRPRSRTFGISSLFSSARSGFTPRSGTEQFSTAHSHFTEADGDTNATQADGEGRCERELERGSDQEAV